MNHQRLEAVKEQKDLGVVFADNMKSSGQCLAAYKKASRMLGMIGRTIIYKNKSILLSLYKTLVRPTWNIAHQTGHHIMKRINPCWSEYSIALHE